MLKTLQFLLLVVVGFSVQDDGEFFQQESDYATEQTDLEGALNVQNSQENFQPQSSYNVEPIDDSEGALNVQNSQENFQPQSSYNVEPTNDSEGTLNVENSQENFQLQSSYNVEPTNDSEGTLNVENSQENFQPESGYNVEPTEGIEFTTIDVQTVDETVPADNDTALIENNYNDYDVSCTLVDGSIGECVEGCILPPYPVHGTYEVLTDQQGVPGDKLQFAIIRVSCIPGYSMTQFGYDKQSSETQDVYCINGMWSQPINKCVRFCKLDPDPSIHFMCSGTACNKYVAPDTVVEPVCNFYYSSESLPYMKCRAGRWNYVARCTPDCGRLTPYGLQLIIDGKSARRGEVPWHAGIYRKKQNGFEQICGGSLVSDKIVISAAHCFWSDVRKLLPAAGFAVAVGKLYRAWDEERDFDSQKSYIEEIRISSLFAGGAAHFQEDIAVLILTSTIVYKSYIRPVCLDFDIMFDTLQLQDSNYGKVAGWGLTAANGQASEILKTVRMPFISAGICVKTLPPSFRPYITGDKFCAGYTNGTVLCSGDSGGGIAFAEREQGADRYYLRGIVSTAPVLDNQLCNDATYTTFTRIIKHEPLIKIALVDVSNSCPPDMFQCEDYTCQDDESDCSENW